MTINDKIKDEKLQYDINREAQKIWLLFSEKIGKYEYLTGEEILPYNQRQIIEQANFAYYPWEKALEKQVGAIKFLDFSNKQDELKQTEIAFLKNYADWFDY